MKIKRALFIMALSTAMSMPLAGAAYADAEEIYKNGEMVLSVPEEYKDMLIIDAPEDDKDGVLFCVSDKASVDAVKKHERSYAEGVGYLFSIAKTDEKTARKMLCGDMSGIEIFAVDDEGAYYLYQHPTDFRLEFDDDADQDASLARWEELNEWAYEDVRDAFISQNGLQERKYGNTDFDIYLAKIAYEGFTDYTIGIPECEPLSPGDVDPSQFLARLDCVDLEYTDEGFPEGECVVLAVENENRRYDIIEDKNGDTFIREVIALDDGTEVETVYKAELPDDKESVYDVVYDWYQALAGAQDESSEKSDKSVEGITEKDAIRIALKHAGISEREITSSEVHEDFDDGRHFFEVVFHVGDIEYSYEIGFENGDVLEHAVEVDD